MEEKVADELERTKVRDLDVVFGFGVAPKTDLRAGG
jgi:hypothetical protein